MVVVSSGQVTIVDIEDGKDGKNGDRGFDGKDGRSIRLFTTNHIYEQKLVDHYSKDGYTGEWYVIENTINLRVDDGVQIRVFNKDKKCDSWIIAVVKEVTGENAFKAVSKGLIEKGDKGERGIQGVQGLQGPKGDQGIPGVRGYDGRTQYTHLAYADDANGGGFSQNDSNKAYIGMYQDFMASDSSDPTKYRWSKMRGPDGPQGIPGTPGVDGRTPYVHFAYAESADGKVGFSIIQTGKKRYIGTYTDYTQVDSTDPTKYRWVDMVGTVEVGGRNYIRHYDWNTTMPFSSKDVDWKFERIEDSQAKSQYMLKATCVKGGSGGFHKPLVDLRGSGWQGKQMTWSFDMKVSRNINFTYIGFELGGLRTNVAVTTSWKRISNTFKVAPNSLGNWSCVFYANDFQVGDIVYLRDPQLEDGIVATTPKAAPEDVEDRISLKADNALTQEQINALNEKNSIMRAEWEAKASLDTLNKAIAEYKIYTLQNDKDKAKSEKNLILLNQRLVENIRNLKNLAERWNFLDKYFQVGNEGIVFGEQNGNTCAKMSNDRFSIFSAGTEVMYISKGTLFIENGIFSKSIQIGHFIEEQYHLNLDMNIIKYVG